MPFFATVPASKFKKDQPIPVRGSKSGSTPIIQKLSRTRSHPTDYSSFEKIPSDISSIADTESTLIDIKEFEVSPRSPFLHVEMPRGSNQAEKFSGSDFQERRQDRAGRHDTGRSQGRPSNVRIEPHEVPNIEVEDYNRQSFETLGNDAPFPVIQIYEQIHQLRLHGATVKFTSKSRGDCLLPDAFVRNSAAYRRGANSPDPLNPTDVEISSLNHALANVLNAGGDVEFLPLPLKQSSTSLKCEACSDVFLRHQDLHDHVSCQIKCKICRVPMPCQTFLEEHMGKAHPQRNSGSYASPVSSPFAGTRDRDEPQWQQ